MTTCGWHPKGGRKPCGKLALRGKRLGTHLCKLHDKEFVRRWGDFRKAGEPGERACVGKHPESKRPVL